MVTADGAARDGGQAAAEVVHPSWCDRQACTAKPTPTMDEYVVAGAHGRHVSAKVGGGAEKLRLVQSVAPWSTSVILYVVDDHVLPLAAFDLATLGRHLATLGAVPSGPLTEAELAGGRDRAVLIGGSPVYTRDMAGQWLAYAVRDLVTAGQVDPLRLVDQLRRDLAVHVALTDGQAS